MRALDIPARSVLTVPRVFRPEKSTFERDYASRSMPVVVEGVADEWPATGKWPPERLMSTCGDRKALVTRYVGNSTAGARQMLMAVRDYVSIVCGRDPRAVELGWAGEPVAVGLPELAAELRLPYLVRTDHSETASFISGPREWPYRHVSNQFHFHPGLHAFAAQIQGRKLFRLYDPRETGRVGGRKPWTPMPSRGSVEIHKYDPVLEHRLAAASCYEVLLEPGDLLFIPASWWHLVANEEFAILATTFYPAPWNEWRLMTTPGIATVFDRIRRHALWRDRRKRGHFGLA